VTLLEREDQVGGQLASPRSRGSNHQYADWSRGSSVVCRKLPVTVELGVEANLDAVLERRPDVVVVATAPSHASRRFPAWSCPR